VPDRTDNPFSDRLNAAPKYVVSNSLSTPLPWENSTLITGNVPRAVTELNEQLSGDLVLLGSGRILQSLMKDDLVDQFLLTIHPLAIGAGHRLFPPEGPRVSLHLTATEPTTTGAIIARYELERMPPPR
jgi:dihydrofolate reductase